MVCSEPEATQPSCSQSEVTSGKATLQKWKKIGGGRRTRNCSVESSFEREKGETKRDRCLRNDKARTSK